jgi:hypothetical protein
MKKTPSDIHVEDNRFELLKELLLEEDREKFDSLNDEFAGKVNPLIQEKIEDLRNNFPEYFGDTITETIKYQINNSQDEVIEALYPIIGKLIKKSIVSEITKLNERINKTIKETFSFQERIKRLFSKKAKISDGEIILQEVFKPIIEELFIIEKDSGLLKGNYSKGSIADKDMVSGMLTAIKSFAEDAFSKEGQNLEDIKFETFQISIHNFKTIYIAIATSGASNSAFNEEISSQITDLAEIILRNRSLLEDELKLNELIKEHILSQD